jgi:glycosyltransferase involved in cell wall biosynthesis
MPTYNRSHLLTESIQSVFDQTFQDFELIVVDDGSTDNTGEMVDSFRDPRIRYIYQENRGVAAARNTGIKAANGEYIAFLDSDDLWLTQKLELDIKLLDSRPDIPLTCSAVYAFDGDTGKNIGGRWPPESYLRELQEGSRQPLTEFLSRGSVFGIVAVDLRRQVFDEVGFFDESLSCGEDYDMLVRILQRFPIGIVNMPVVRVRLHRTSLSSNYDIAYPGTLAAIDKVINSYSLSREQIKLIRKFKLWRTHFDYACYKIFTDGDMSLGRQKLIAAIRANPWRVKTYVYFAVSLLGNRVIRTFISLKNRLF